jgi:tRNA(Ile)-lysidine synthase
MLEKLIQAVNTYRMIKKGDHVLVAISGGADSVALLFALSALKDSLDISISAAHVNHGLRGKESDDDQIFVERFCESLNIELKTTRLNIQGQKNNHESIEQCARRLRYEFLENCCINAKIATAHTASDNTETVLLNLIRGTGLKGLCGIPPVRNNIIRPLIFCSRHETEAYCKENNLTFITDQSNFDTQFTRNKLRLQVIPKLTEINPSLHDTISRACALTREDCEYLDTIAFQAKVESMTTNGYSVSTLNTLPPPIFGRVIKGILTEGGVEPTSLRISMIKEMLDQPEGKVNLAKNKFAVLKNDTLSIQTFRQNFKNLSHN